MKLKLVFLLLVISLLAASCSSQPENIHKEPSQQTDEQIRGMWLSCYELSDMLNSGEEDVFVNQVQTMAELCVENKINNVFVHVRPFFDAMYPSRLLDWSVYALSSNGKQPGFDPLEIIIDKLSEKDISVHAWLNPYRVSYDPSYVAPEEIADCTFSCDVGVYLDPSNVKSQRFMLECVRELLTNYDLSGIHIDDYFYPETDIDFDCQAYENYKDSGGKLSRDKWRCENVNSLVAAVYSLVHSYGDELVFSISPAANIIKNKHSLYADVALWMSEPGYADWIIPQLYFGFEHDTMPFKVLVELWEKMNTDDIVKLVCGIALYKSESEDSAAGSGADEWIENDDVINRQIEYISADSNWSGVALFSYGSLHSGLS